MDEIMRANEILQKKFVEEELLHTKEPTGKLTKNTIKRLLRETSLMTPKEINALIRHIKEEDFEYRMLPTLIFDVRFELARSRILETNLDKLQVHLI